MKKLIVFILILAIHLPGYCQDLFEITAKSTQQNAATFQNKVLHKQSYTGKVNIESLTSERITITLPEEGQVEYNVLENTEKKWIGQTEDNTGNLIIIKGENTVLASLTTRNTSYQLYSLKNGEAFLIELAPSAEERICDTDHSPTLQHTEEITSNNLVSPTNITTETLKILVAYNASAESTIASQTGASAKDYALLSVEMANMSYQNSAIGHRIELSACIKVDYQETGTLSTDLSRFRNTSDGYMDEIHGLRDIYAADVCVLFVGTGAGHGVASTLNATATSAFCVVKSTLHSLNYYVFAHEIGHLQGARHDLLQDPGITPHKYAHGYTSQNPNSKWKTLMSYGVGCDDCREIQYWSNPYVVYPVDGQLMGTIEYENNARVLNETTEAMKAFRVPSVNLTLTQSGLSNVRYGKIQATTKISTSGTVTQATSSNLILKAPTIELNAGFSTVLGSEITIGPYN